MCSTHCNRLYWVSHPHFPTHQQHKLQNTCLGFTSSFLSGPLNRRPIYTTTSLKVSTGCVIASSNLTCLKFNFCFSFQTCFSPSVLHVSNRLPVHLVAMTKTWCFPLLLFFLHTSQTSLSALSLKHTPLTVYLLHCYHQSPSHNHCLPVLLQQTSVCRPLAPAASSPHVPSLFCP